MNEDYNKQLRDELAKAENDGHFVFVPSPLPYKKSVFIPTLSIVDLKDIDFYEDGGKHLFHHTGYRQLANAAGFSWVSEKGRTILALRQV